MLRVIDTSERNQQWLGVADLMKAEAEEAANKALDKYAARIKKIARLTADRVIREGQPAEEIVKLIDEDADIGILVLAAGTANGRPRTAGVESRPRPPALSRSRWRSCPAISATRTSTPVRKDSRG